MKSSCVVSYGIACVRRNPDTRQLEILMVRKKHTYALIEFVRGKFDPFKDRDLEFMFSNMAIFEKSLIQGRQFELLWHFCNNRTDGRHQQAFSRALRKFTTLSERESGKALENLLTGTKNKSLLWEIPKGRASGNETAIMSAVREFQEETGLAKHQYRILLDEGTVEYSFVDCGVRYRYVYFIAVMVDHSDVPVYDYGNKYMIQEVGDIQFLASSAIQELNNRRLAKIAKIMIRKAKRHLS